MTITMRSERKLALRDDQITTSFAIVSRVCGCGCEQRQVFLVLDPNKPNSRALGMSAEEAAQMADLVGVEVAKLQGTLS